MPALDFTEISAPTSGPGRDQFELFAREVLEWLGFKVIVGPDRGPDGGRDLIVEEVRTGIGGETRVRWLVSCKHKAHSGSAVTPDDERNVHDRLRTHNCDGFLAFYSTVPSSGLAATPNALSSRSELLVLDPERVEKRLLSSATGLELARRFFPQSMARWQTEHPGPAKLFKETPRLECLHCRQDVLDPKRRGIIVAWTTLPKKGERFKEHTERFYWCCKGGCDEALRQRYRRPELVDGWNDIPDLAIPVGYIRWVMAVLNGLHDGSSTYSPEAFENVKTLLLNLFPLVSRNLTADEKRRQKELMMLPDHLGGFGE